MIVCLRIFRSLFAQRKKVYKLFRSAFNRGASRYFVNPGCRVRDKMSVVVDSKGNRHLEKVGETDFYALIQSFKDSVDIKQIVERCAMSGDMSMLQKLQGTYGDYVGIPGDLRSLEHLRMTAEGAYDALSDEIKAKIAFDDFLEGFSTQEKFDALQSVLSTSTVTTVEGEVNSNES